ncbi:hypothetical protein [Actinokineospora sp. NBRC 105648]|uniref:hypothetical protein n=1 Tax=Actinokineospora sp. NBRC 105648 TaxID=3032206 RepID=UPI0024A22831|nr:hypothetical protein [Actinokineospora sp. NBRC 105648]GLZ37932.1 hypothetical protein Acsp05_15560 [Actinokineospora sp. NBRC 105648]
MRIAIVAVVAAALSVVVPGVAHADSVTVGPYPSEASCLPDKQRYAALYPTYGCYQRGTGWYFTYRNV